MKRLLMSAFGPKQTSAMRRAHVRFRGKADINSGTMPALGS